MAAADAVYSGVVAGGGALVITIRASGRQVWTVSQVSTEMGTAPSGSTCALKKNGFQVTALVATGDVADGNPPITIGPSDQLTIEWGGCTPGNLGKAYVIYDDGT